MRTIDKIVNKSNNICSGPRFLEVLTTSILIRNGSQIKLKNLSRVIRINSKGENF